MEEHLLTMLSCLKDSKILDWGEPKATKVNATELSDGKGFSWPKGAVYAVYFNIP